MLTYLIPMSTKSNAGRPKVPKSEYKGEVIGARFSAAEEKHISAAISRSGSSKPDWVRNSLLSAAGGVKH